MYLYVYVWIYFDVLKNKKIKVHQSELACELKIIDSGLNFFSINYSFVIVKFFKI